jgi:hypothetical protein
VQNWGKGVLAAWVGSGQLLGNMRPMESTLADALGESPPQISTECSVYTVYIFYFILAPASMVVNNEQLHCLNCQYFIDTTAHLYTIAYFVHSCVNNHT